MDEHTAINTNLHLRRVLETLVESIEDKTNLSTDELLSKPPGNFLAAEIKAIQDDSCSVFPQSVYSNMLSRRNRWRSVYNSDFYPKTPEVYDKWCGENILIDKKQSMCIKPWSAPTFMKDRHASLSENIDREKMFMNWKIPSRIADEPPSSRHGSEQIQPKLGINRRVPGAAHLKCGDLLPQIAGKETTLTQKRKQSQPESVSPSFLRKNDTNDTNGIIRQSKSFRTQQLLKTFKGPATFTTLDSFLKTATDREKDILEKTMKLIYTKDASSFDAIKNMENWLSKASAEDRNVAASFFETIGVQMMAHSSAQERETVTKILSLLKNYQRNDEQYLHRSKTVGNIKTSPKYVRLLTPSTRANKWLHQTWHHLPSYQDDNPVFNKSAVYTEPGKVPFRHWNIHPDWQLQSEFY